MILITGATGLIGGHVFECLRAGSFEVDCRVLVRDESRGALFEERGGEVVVADFDEPDTLAAAVQGISAVFLASPSNPAMVRQQRALVDAVLNAGGVERGVRFVKLSGFMTALNSASQSGRWHASIEHYIEDCRLAATFLHPPFFMQNLERLAPLLSAESALTSSIGERGIAMVDARDVAAVGAACLLKPPAPGLRLVPTGPRAVTFAELAGMFSDLLGRAVEYRRVTEAEERAGLQARGAPPWRVEVVLEFQRGFAAGEGEVVTTVVRDYTGHAPRSVAAFLAEHREMFAPT